MNFTAPSAGTLGFGLKALGLSALTLALHCESPDTEPPPPSQGPTGVGGAAGGGWGGGGMGIGGGGMGGNPMPTEYVQKQSVSLPCNFPSDVDYYEAQNTLLVACTPVFGGGGQPGDRNHLFLPIPSTTLQDFTAVSGRFISQYGSLSGNKGAVTANDGIYRTPGGNNFISFPTGTNTGGGLVWLGGKLFVATANLDPATFMYNAGTVTVWDTAPDGTINEGSVRSIATSDLNATGIVPLNSSLAPLTFAVVNSGPYGPPFGTASLDIVDAGSESIVKSVKLGSLYAQTSGEVAVSPDGKTVIIGTSDGSGRLFFVDVEKDWSGGDIPPSVSLAGKGTVGEFHASVQIGDGRVFVTWSSGLVSIVDLQTRGVLQSIDLATEGAGPSAFWNGSLWQALPYSLVEIGPK